MMEITLAGLCDGVRRAGGDPAAAFLAIEDTDGFIEDREQDFKIFRHASGVMIVELSRFWECVHADYDEINEERDEMAALLVRARKAAEDLATMLGEG